MSLSSTSGGPPVERAQGLGHRPAGRHLRVPLAEQVGHHLAGIGVVLDDQNLRPREIRQGADGERARRDRRHRRVRLDGGPGRLGGSDADRQMQTERGAAIASIARRLDRAAVQLDDVPDDGQPEAEAGVRPRRAAVGLAEAIEDERQHLGD